MSSESEPPMAAAIEPAPAPGVTESKATASEESKPVETKPEDSQIEPKTEVSEKANQPAITTTPLSKLFSELPSITDQTGHSEMWGFELKDANDIPTSIILEKFLRANAKDVAKAKTQLIAALDWRKKVNPIKLLEENEFDTSRFGDLGYVTIYPKNESHGKEIVTWNIYGAVRDIKKTFGDVEEFTKWRSALMELSVRELGLSSASEAIPENGEDPYQMVQVHDYLNVSFLRMDPNIRAASKKVIETFSMAYPELLKEKFFVNVPLVTGWVFTAMKIFLSFETVKKFHPLSYGKNLAGELPQFGSELPPAYGGKGKEAKEGLTVKYAAAAEAKATEENK